MARRRKGRPVNGILLIDKPAGLTSNATLQRAKRALFAAKAGHTGSLDPLATGVLPLCFGEATQFSRFLLDADKIYVSTFVLGVSTSTGDADGDIVASVDASKISLARVEDALTLFRGAIEQIPPMYSALKHDGERLYKLARQGVEVERKARPVTIYELELLDYTVGEEVALQLRIHCSKGTYIRSLAEDIGRVLACGAHVGALRRVQSGPFGVQDCLPLDQLEAYAEEKNFDALDQLLLPVDSGLAEMPEVRVSEDTAFYLRQGQAVLVPNAPLDGYVKLALKTGGFFGVGETTDDGRLAPSRLLVSNSNPL